MTEGLRNDEVAELYRRYGAFVRRRCLVLLRDRALADDALQEVFLKLLRAGSGVREAEEPLRWIYRVADRTCFDHLRSRKRARRSSPIEDHDGQGAQARELLHPGTEPEMRWAAIELLSALDEEDQRIAVMAFVDGMSQEEIGGELGCSRMTVIKRIARLRERAGRLLARDARTSGAPS